MTVNGFVKTLLRVIPLSCLAAGLLFLALCLGFWQHEKHFLQAASTADGVVVALDTHNDSNGSKMYAPVFTFTTVDGQPHTSTSTTSSNPPGFEVGQHVPVIYDPMHPAGADINSFWANWLVSVVLGVFAVAFLAAAIFFFLLSWAINKRAEPAPIPAVG